MAGSRFFVPAPKRLKPISPPPPRLSLFRIISPANNNRPEKNKVPEKKFFIPPFFLHNRLLPSPSALTVSGPLTAPKNSP